MEKYEQLLNLIKEARHIVFFGGAGVSTASGIKDFRSKDGLYNCISNYGVPYETILSHSYFVNHTETFFDFYKKFMINKNALTNICHTFLAKLENKKELTIVTQNIDDLHTLAGSKNVIELHGSIKRNYCTHCNTFYDLDFVMKSSNIPTCPKCGHIVKPDVVLYEEPLDSHSINEACKAIEKADLMIVAGTSLNVYPAAGLINYFNGDNIVLIDKSSVRINRSIKLYIQDDIKKVFQFLDDNIDSIN